MSDLWKAFSGSRDGGASSLVVAYSASLGAFRRPDAAVADALPPRMDALGRRPAAQSCHGRGVRSQVAAFASAMTEIGGQLNGNVWPLATCPLLVR